MRTESTRNSDTTPVSAPKKRGFSWLLRAFIRPLSQFSVRLPALFLCRKSLVIGHSRHSATGPGGTQINAFADPWIEEIGKTRALYAEFRSDRQSTVPPSPLINLELNFIMPLCTLGGILTERLSLLVALNRYWIRELIPWLEHCGVSEKRLSRIINRIFGRFIVEYCFYRFLFFWIRPPLIVTVDMVATGLVAAARVAGVKVIENQHGHFHEYKPDYIMDAEALGAHRDSLALPDYLVVFGPYFAECLLKWSLWRPSEIVCVGHRLLDLYREERASGKSTPRYDVLIVTQWTLTEHTRRLLATLTQLLSSEKSLTIALKTHPNESPERIAEYAQIAEHHPRLTIIAEPGTIYPCLLQTRKLVIGFFSTALLEAMALEIPVVSIVTSTTPFGLQGSKLAPELAEAITVVDEEHVLSAVRDHLSERANSEARQIARKIASQYLYVPGCQARVRTLVHSLLNHGT